MSNTLKLKTGDLVNLRTDKNKRIWQVAEYWGSGTWKIVQHGRPESIYTTMYVPASRLQRATTSTT